MARAILVVRRRADASGRLEAYLDALNRNLAPDNIVPHAPAFVRASGVEAAIFNPNGATRLEGTSVCIGALLEEAPLWHAPGARLPDGTYALLRADANRVELAADAAASRTIWYVLTDEELIASTSQRAIVTLLGSFEMNREALPWLLSSGTLGPAAGWDARLEQVRPGERVTLDRGRWRLSRSGQPPEFRAAADRDEAAHRARLAEIVEAVCKRLTFDSTKWTLPLSGGVDSRALLFHLHKRRGLETITWGMTGTREQDGNDAQIARTLADVFGIGNRFFPTDLSSEPRERLIQRFLTAGEGRVARISGYLDGFLVWKTLFDEGADGIIRGDEAFGSVLVRNARGVRHTASLTLLSDFFSPHELAAFDLPEQHVPLELERKREESLSTWRDRLYQQFRVPAVLAGLTDLKAAYVEVANPLLARAVLDCVRELPDGLRTEKRLWRDLVRSWLPDVPFASRIAVPSLEEVLTDRALLSLMLDEMRGSGASDLFSPALRNKVCATINAALLASRAPRRPSTLKLRLARAIPPRLRAAARTWLSVKPSLDPLAFAFRSFLASRMNALLKLDAATPPADMQRAVNL
ncbi:MAG TPA: asparagine synthase-related protein [Gammaproteobacteria bacterium]|nr:asparagine synthase-related protein [Gammaproteobacteria bacterium]